MASTRSYDNRLRQEQAQGTADRIVGALCELLVDERPSSVSIPAVAKRAGVSVRTVYSHFPTKDDLFEGIRPYVERTYFRHGDAEPWSLDVPIADLARSAAPAFARATPLFVALGRAGIDDDDHAQQRNDERQGYMATVLRHQISTLDDDEVERLAAAFGAIVSWPVVQRLQRAGQDQVTAGETLGWVAEALVAHAAAHGGPGGHGAPPKRPVTKAAEPAAARKTAKKTTTKPRARRSSGT